jgi:putative molybdopterin biosynthesis protein
MSPSNRVRERREALGLSQAELASSCGLSRQSIGAIEAARATPSVEVALRLARALETQVETLFSSTSEEAELSVETFDSSPGRRAMLVHVGGRWLAHPLSAASSVRSADALLPKVRHKRATAELLRSPSECRENVLVLGCAPALGLLCDRLNARGSSGRFLWFSESSTRALSALAGARAHVAGVHLMDDRTGEPNLSDVRRSLAGRAADVITLGRWEAGLVCRTNDAKAVKRPADLGRRGVRIALREKGSGARRLLDRVLDREGISEARAFAGSVESGGQLEVAQAVAMGAADVGVATRDAALAFGLSFHSLAEERYDLVLARDDRDDPRLLRLLDMLTAAPMRRELAALGYDVSETGSRVAEL